MRREMKVSVSVALSLMLGFILLSSLSTVSTANAGIAAPVQSGKTIQPEQQVIARVTVRNEQEMDRLLAVGVDLLDQRTGDDFYLLTTFEKSEQLSRQGYPVTLLYVRGLDFHGTWKSLEAPAGDCTYSIDVTQQIVTGNGGVGEFELTTGPDCEWVIISDAAWLRVNGNSQGTGSATIGVTIDMNQTSFNRVGHIFIAGNVYTVLQGATFDDVPLTHPFYTQIGRISALGITQGCGNDNFCPDIPVARDQMAALIVRSLGEFNPPTPAMQRFTDVPPSNIFYNFVDRLAVLGITSGCSPTTYCPADGLTREQAAAFIIRALGETNPPTPPAQRFADVPPSSSFYAYVDRLAALQITGGCSANPPLYCPLSPVTRGQTAVFLVKAFDL